MVKSILQSLGVDERDEPLCIQFANTVGSRNAESPNEYLPDPDAVKNWLVARKLADPVTELGQDGWKRALALRDAIYTLLATPIGTNLPSEALAPFHAELALALAGLRLDQGAAWEITLEGHLDRALALVSLSTAELVTGPDRERVRICADPVCGWLFLDLSKNRSRRWCSMSDCGNLAKARRFQERKRGKSGQAS